MTTSTLSKHFIEEVKEIGIKQGIDGKWCGIFAKELLKVADKLKITLEVGTEYNEKLSISVVSAENFITILFRNEYGLTFNLVSVVGFRDGSRNQIFFSGLLFNSELVELIAKDLLKCPVDNIKSVSKIEKCYSPCRFYRHVRLNKFNINFCRFVSRYESLEEYLKAIGDDGIYFNELTPEECIARLNKLGIKYSLTIDNLRRYKVENYDWTEYLHIMTEPGFNYELFLAGDCPTLMEFEKQLSQHINGIILIDETRKRFGKEAFPF